MRIPRKTKKAIRSWVRYDIPLTGGRRNRVIRYLSWNRSRQGFPQLRRRPDGRVSLLDLP